MDWLILVESNTTGSGRLFCARARELGLVPVLFARDPTRYPYVALDGIEHRVVDTTDVDAVRATGAKLPGRVAGVTSSSEYSIATASEVARGWGLPHPDPDAVRACRDKHTQRVRLAEAGVPGPAFGAATTPDEAVAAAGRIGLPVVVKPVAGSGSIGVRRCASLAEVAAAASAVLDVDPVTLALPPQRAVVVEEYLVGDEYSVETLDTTIVGITRKYLGPEPYFVETGHDFPAVLPVGERSAIGGAAVAALRALGLGWGAAHVELRHRATAGAGEARIVEVNPRLAGGMIPRMVAEATGIDMIDFMVARAAGRASVPRPTRYRSAAIRFLVAPADGRFDGVDGLDEARARPGVVEVGLVREPGQDIVLTHSFRDRLGYVIAGGGSGAEAARAAEAGLRTLQVRMSYATEGSSVP